MFFTQFSYLGITQADTIEVQCRFFRDWLQVARPKHGIFMLLALLQKSFARRLLQPDMTKCINYASKTQPSIALLLGYQQHGI